MNIIQPISFIKEEWKFITDKSVPDIIPNKYMISNTGKAINIKTNHILTPVITWNGYYRINLQLKSGIRRYYTIHRIVAIEFIPNNDYNLQVNHINGDKSNNNIWNLEWVTASQNIKHAFDHGLKTQYKGEECSWSTINNNQAEKIAQMICTQEYTYQEIADIIGCSKSVVGDIACGQNWKYLYNKYNLKQYRKEFVIRFSDDDLHKLFKYFQDHKYKKYKYKNDLFREALYDIFNIVYDNRMSATMSRLYNRVTRRDISDQYDF